MSHPGLPELPGSKPSTRVHMEGPMTPDAYAAEDGLLEHRKEERPLVLRRLDAAM